MKYEYKSISTNIYNVESKLNEYGKNGWECITVVRLNNSNECKAILKRSIIEQQSLPKYDNSVKQFN